MAEANATPCNDHLPCDCWVITSEPKEVWANRQTHSTKFLLWAAFGVLADDVMALKVCEGARCAASCEIVCRRKCRQFQIPNLFGDQAYLLGWTAHAHSDVGLTYQQVCGLITNDQFKLNFWLEFTEISEGIRQYEACKSSACCDPYRVRNRIVLITSGLGKTGCCCDHLFCLFENIGTNIRECQTVAKPIKQDYAHISLERRNVAAEGLQAEAL